MPVEIRELIIRARVVNGSNGTDDSEANTNQAQAELIANCVEQVLKILERRRER